MQGSAATNLTGAVFFLDFCTVLRQRVTGRLPNTSDTQVTQDHCSSINETLTEKLKTSSLAKRTCKRGKPFLTRTNIGQICVAEEN